MSSSIVFMGTPEFAASILSRLINRGRNIIAVYTQPPKPQDRGHKVTLSPVHKLAKDENITVYHPSGFKNDMDRQEFISLNADIAIVAAYGVILPKAILEGTKFGCVNVHSSLLPRWRGAAPVQRAIMAGDDITGVSIMQMDEGLDTGAVFSMAKVPIKDDTSLPVLTDLLAQAGGQGIVDLLDYLEVHKKLPPCTAQPEDGVTYAHKITAQEGLINWQQSSKSLLRQINALNPWPGTYVFYDGMRLKVISASLEEGAFVANNDSVAGEVVAIKPKLLVTCGDGVIALEALQKPGGKVLNARDFLNGTSIEVGYRFSV